MAFWNRNLFVSFWFVNLLKTTSFTKQWLILNILITLYSSCCCGKAQADQTDCTPGTASQVILLNSLFLFAIIKQCSYAQIKPIKCSGNHEEEDGTAVNPPCHHSDSTPPSQSTAASFPIPSTSHPNPVSFPTPASISTSFHTAPSFQSSSFPAPMTVPNVGSIHSTLPSPSRAPSTSTMTSFDKPVYYIMRYDKVIYESCKGTSRHPRHLVFFKLTLFIVA